MSIWTRLGMPCGFGRCSSHRPRFGLEVGLHLSEEPAFQPRRVRPTSGADAARCPRVRRVARGHRCGQARMVQTSRRQRATAARHRRYPCHVGQRARSRVRRALGAGSWALRGVARRAGDSPLNVRGASLTPLSRTGVRSRQSTAASRRMKRVTDVGPLREAADSRVAARAKPRRTMPHVHFGSIPSPVPQGTAHRTTTRAALIPDASLAIAHVSVASYDSPGGSSPRANG